MNLLSETEAYLRLKRPMGIGDFTLSVLAAGEYNQNYLLQAADHKYVVRISVSQLSGVRNQLQHEYNTLRYLGNTGIAPAAYYLDMEGFRFPIMIEEYIEGQPIEVLSDDLLAKIGAAIARINNVAITRPHPFEVREISYTKDIDALFASYCRMEPNEHNSRAGRRDSEICVCS